MESCLACTSKNLTDSNYPSKAQDQTLLLDKIKVCPRCNYGYATPVYSQEHLNKFYASGSYWHNTNPSSSLRIHNKVQSEYRVNAVTPLLNKVVGQRILDIGAGLGDTFYWLKRSATQPQAEYFFIEPDKDNAKKILNEYSELKIKRLLSIENTPEQFDLIFANHVLEHVADPNEFLKKIISSLSIGGLAYIEVPLRDDLSRDCVFPHISFFTTEAIESISKKLSIENLSIESFGDSQTLRSTTKSSLKVKVLSKLFDLSVSQNLWPLQRFFNHKLYAYSKTPGDLWIRWIFKKK